MPTFQVIIMERCLDMQLSAGTSIHSLLLPTFHRQIRTMSMRGMLVISTKQQMSLTALFMPTEKQSSLLIKIAIQEAAANGSYSELLTLMPAPLDL